jgi:hypothetical protein
MRTVIFRFVPGSCVCVVAGFAVSGTLIFFIKVFIFIIIAIFIITVIFYNNCYFL